MSPFHMLMLVGTPMLWGFNFAAVKFGLRDFPPLLLLSLRFGLVAALMLPFVRRPAPGQIRPVILISTVLGALHFGLTFSGMQWVDAASAAIIVQLGVPFSVLLAVVMFNDRLGWRRIAGMAVAFAGVVVLIGEPRMEGSLLGVFLLVCGTLAWAVGNTLVKRHAPLDPFMLTAWTSLLATPQLLVASFILEDGHGAALMNAGWAGWGGMTYSVVGASLLAYNAWYFLMSRYPISRLMPAQLTAPFFAVLSGVTLLGEPLTPRLLVGGALTVLGVAIIEIRQIQRGRTVAASEPKPGP